MNRQKVGLIAAALSMAGFGGGGLRIKSDNVPGFSHTPGDARARGRAKRKARLRRFRALEVQAIYLHRKTKNNKWFRLRGINKKVA